MSSEMPLAELVSLANTFLAANGFEKAAAQLSKEAKKKGIAPSAAESTRPSPPDLATLYTEWQKQNPPVAANSKATRKRKTAPSPSESDSSSDSSSESGKEAPVSKKRKRSSTPSDDSSSDSDSSDSSKSSESSSSDDEDADSDGESSSSDDSSEASSLSDSDSESSDSDSSSSSGDSDSDSDSSSSSDSESDAPPPKKAEKTKKQKKATKATKTIKPETKVKPERKESTSSSSSATLAGSPAEDEFPKTTDTLLITTTTEISTPVSDGMEGMHPDRKRKLPGSFQAAVTETTTEAIPATEENIKRLKKENVPFSRIPADQAIDPRLTSNAYQPYDYAERAHQKLIVTKGKGFTKEKNKGMLLPVRKVSYGQNC